jgi:pyruvate,orthophosphate dikinase
MPGMMDTILNLGLNDRTTAGLAAFSGSPAFAANCRSRFGAMYRDIVGGAPPDDPWAQLRGAIEAVFRSWNSDRARTYRRREAIPDELGTGVTVQAMVYGNRSRDSGTGVLFTRNPATGEQELYGDFLFNAQGEDVVAGTHPTEPIAVLDERLPAVARQLRDAAACLEQHHRDLCDIEFTIEHGRLWLLQCRIGKRSPQAALRIALDMAEDPGFPLTRAEAVERVRDVLADPPRAAVARPSVPPLVVGVPASPGVAAGEVAVSPDGAVSAAAEGRTVILVRAETSPDDVHGMAASAGILTASGGRASHAAVVARGWGIPAVVGAVAVAVDDTGFTVGASRLDVGAPITIDGSTGEVFPGLVAGTTTIVPEAAILRGWADEFGIAVPRAADLPGATAAGAAVVPDATPSTGSPVVSADDVLAILRVKGYASSEAIALALLAAPEAAAAVLDRLAAEGLVEVAGGPLRLTGAGKAAAHDAIARSAEAWERPAAEAALDAFVDLDRRMKVTVTNWQMRDVDGEQVLNDHADPEYDARVLADLEALHVDASAWLAPLVPGLPRLAAYAVRLERAIVAARAGDGRYVSSPRVDSYHSVWFELHEDLILLAGRTRQDEVAAGRA